MLWYVQIDTLVSVDRPVCTAFRLLPELAMTHADRHEQIRSLFNQAVQMVDTERRWFLHSIEDRDLAADVERLLESSACCGSFGDKKSS